MPPKAAIVRIGRYKYRLLEMHLQLRDQQLKAISCVYIDSYIKTSWLPQTKNLQLIHTQLRKKPLKYNTKDSHQTTRGENKRRRGKKCNKNKSKAINKMAIRTHI